MVMTRARIFVGALVLAVSVSGYLFLENPPEVRALQYVVQDGDSLSGTPISQSRIDLTWSQSAVDTTEYLYRCTGSSCTPTLYLTLTGSGGSGGQSDTSLSCGTTYRYSVQSAYGGTNIVTVTTDQCTPAVPTIGTASAASQTAETVTWTDNSNNESGFQIWEATPAAGTLRGTATAGQASGTSSSLTCNTAYTFYVRAYVDTNGRTYYSSNSGATSAATTDQCTPGVPTGVSGSASFETSIDVVWTDSSNNETGFQTERCEGSGCSTGFSLVCSSGPNAVGCLSAGLNCGATYGHRVRAYVTSNGRTYYSDYVPTVYTVTGACTPPTISSVTPTSRAWASSDISVTPTFTDPAGISYVRHCFATSTSCDAGTTAASTFTNASAITHTTDGSWTLCLRASDTLGNWSGTGACYSTYQKDAAAPTVPGTPSASSPNAGSFTVNWSASSDSLSGMQRYELEKSFNAGQFTQVAIPSSNSQSLPSQSEGSYVFRVRAQDVALNLSSYSVNSATITVDTTAPTVPAPTDVGTWSNSTSITFTGTPSDTGGAGLSDCTGQIDVGNTDGAGLAYNASVGADGSHAFTGAEGNTYYYRYSCTDAVGNASALTAWTDGISIDLTAPAFSSKTSFSGWYTSNQISTLTYADSFSGIASGNNPSCTISTEGTSQTCAVTPNVCDNAGNCNTTQVTSNGADIDKTSPTPSTSSGSAASVCAYDGLSRSITWAITTSSDATSGLHSAGYSFTNGSSWQASNQLAESGVGLATTTKTVKVRDVAGNQTTAGTVTAGVVSCVAPPSSAPASPSGSLDSGQGTASLSWSETSNTSGYLIEESTNGGSNYSVIGDNTSGSLTTHDVPKYGAACPKDYYYRVTAYSNDASYNSDTNCPEGYRTGRKCSTPSSAIIAPIRYCTGHFLGE